MPRIVDLGVTKYAWVDAIADVTAPTVAELTGGTDISPTVVTTTSVGPTASDTVNERAITDTANVVVPTIGNYEGTLNLFRDYTAGSPTAAIDPLAIFAAGDVGYLVRRVGKAHDVAFAAADEVEVYKFMVDNPQVRGGQGDGYLKATIPLLQQGQFSVKATVGA